MPCPAPPRLNDHEALRLALLEAGLLLRSAHDDLERFDAARARLLAFCWERLVPHLEHDEAWLLAADTCPTGRLLADAMRTEARAMTAAVLELEGATDPCEAIGAVRIGDTTTL